MCADRAAVCTYLSLSRTALHTRVPHMFPGPRCLHGEFVSMWHGLKSIEVCQRSDLKVLDGRHR